MEIYPAKETLSEPDLLEILSNGKCDLVGQFVFGSNAALLAQVTWQGEKLSAVYKPVQGETPLWDFPPETLANRETAAYLVSSIAGWGLVPPTVNRVDTPFGGGSLQLFIPHDPDLHYFTFTKQLKDQLKSVVLFDALVNNADRKGGHLLVDDNQKIWLIDHGLCFHYQNKLRTVIWDYAGMPVPPELLDILHPFQTGLRRASPAHRMLADLLSKKEFSALVERLHGIIENPMFPIPPENVRAFPYPLV